MLVDDRAALIGSGFLGFDLTDAFDCHMWAFDAGDEGWVMVDAGAGRDIDRVLAVCERDAVAISLTAARKAGVYPLDYVYTPCPIDEVHQPGEEVRFGDLAFTSIPTPGHSHDHHSWLVAAPAKRYLVSGDALFAGGRLALQHIWDCSIPDAIASVERIAEHDFDALLPGHFVFTMEGARRHVDAALDVIARLGCPASVL